MITNYLNYVYYWSKDKSFLQKFLEVFDTLNLFYKLWIMIMIPFSCVILLCLVVTFILYFIG